MWYLLHQQAQEMIAEREREATRRRLLRDGAAPSDPDPRLRILAAFDGSRAAAARLARAAGRLAERTAIALDPCDDGAIVGDATR